MSQITTKILMPQTSANLANTSIVGDKKEAAGFYQNLYNLQTFSWSLTSVTGIMYLQGTLSDNPNASDWVNLHQIICNNTTQNSYITIKGNFTYVRAIINGFLNGTIQNIKVTY